MGLNLLEEDANEREQFDSTVKRLGMTPLEFVQVSLETMHRCAKFPQGSYAKMLAIYANEIAKARAKMTPNVPP